MVALAPNTSETSPWDVHDAFPKMHSRAREAKTTPCTEAPMLKSRSRIEIWLTIYETCDRLESFTRDPIKYRGGFNLEQFVFSSPLVYVDPTGLFEVDPGAGVVSAEQRDYAFNRCFVTCGWNNPGTSTVVMCQKAGGFVTLSHEPSSKSKELQDKMNAIADEASRWATEILNILEETQPGVNNLRNHSALRHCFASAQYAKLLGCACAGCLGHFREQYQYFYQDQGGVTTARQDFNNSIGRGCAGCTGKGNLEPKKPVPGRQVRTFPQGEPQMKQCCYNAFMNDLLWLGPTRPPNSDDVPYACDSVIYDVLSVFY